MSGRIAAFGLIALAAAGWGMARSGAAPAAAPANKADRIATKPYLNMPDTAAGKMPALLSQTGVFANLRTLTPARGLLPYDLILSFWSDGAQKDRLVAIPEGKVAFSPDGDWVFPRGTVFVKTFELATDAGQPKAVRRLETRLLVLASDGGVYGVTYKWRPDLSDADLVAQDGINEVIAIHDTAGQRTQTWSYPGRQDCLACHNAHTAGQLGPKTRQLDHPMRYPDGTVENELRHWNRLGLFSPALKESDIGHFTTLATADDKARSAEDKARSWLDANCSQCHRPGGTVANFDARYQTPLAQQNLIDGPVLIDQGIDRPRVISPHDPWRSLVIRRTDTNDDTRMPPIARHTIDHKGVGLLRQWILSMPGRDVLAPPTMIPAGGDFKTAVTVSLGNAEPGAQIHYTLDGSAPGPDDPVYNRPIRLDGPAVVRARAYKDGMTRSIIAQQTYVVGS